MDARDVLAAAFDADPMFTYIEPDARRRPARLRWFFSTALRLGRQRGRVDVDQGRGAAIWLPPGVPFGLSALVTSGMVLAPLRLRSAYARFDRMTKALERAGEGVHPEPSWYLFILGVAPGHQGQGVGGRLIAPVLAEADATGLPCYLETVNERNLAFYGQHGFEVAQRVDVDGLPPFWLLIRLPR